MKQIVSIDLTWTLRNSDSTEFSIHDFPVRLDSIIDVQPFHSMTLTNQEISESQHQSIETLARFTYPKFRSRFSFRCSSMVSLHHSHHSKTKCFIIRLSCRNNYWEESSCQIQYPEE